MGWNILNRREREREGEREREKERERKRERPKESGWNSERGEYGVRETQVDKQS